ncbi:MAG: hypothetical protein PVJ02_18635 [Gemmatimonadota bacterium]|jgi:hypothetical protein
MDKSETLSVLLMVLLLAFAVVIVDDRWLRVGIAVLPALMLAQRALKSSAVRQTSDTEVTDDRRQDHEVRGYIDELLKHFREFYATCHLTGAGVLTPEAAEERATNLERELNRLLATITRTARARTQAGADGADVEPSPDRESG